MEKHSIILERLPTFRSVDGLSGRNFTAGRWNQTIAAAIEDSTAAAITNTQVSVFAASCNIYAPFYRQAALPEVLWPDPAASERALSVAYADVEAAFDYHMNHLNNGRPFILAGHRQASNLLLWLLERRNALHWRRFWDMRSPSRRGLTENQEISLAVKAVHWDLLA